RLARRRPRERRAHIARGQVCKTSDPGGQVCKNVRSQGADACAHSATWHREATVCRPDPGGRLRPGTGRRQFADLTPDPDPRPDHPRGGGRRHGRGKMPRMTRLLLASILLVGALAAPAAQGARTLIVLNKADATLVKVDPASGKILGTV